MPYAYFSGDEKTKKLVISDRFIFPISTPKKIKSAWDKIRLTEHTELNITEKKKEEIIEQLKKMLGHERDIKDYKSFTQFYKETKTLRIYLFSYHYKSSYNLKSLYPSKYQVEVYRKTHFFGLIPEKLIKKSEFFYDKEDADFYISKY